MPRTIGQAIGFLLGFAIALWLSPFSGSAAESSSNPAPPFRSPEPLPPRPSQPMAR